MAFNPGKRFQYKIQQKSSSSDDRERHPPEAKRRRTKESSSSNENGHVEGLWDDSMTFTQAELDDIDDIMLSQAVNVDYDETHDKSTVSAPGDKTNVSMQASTSKSDSFIKKDNSFQRPFTLSRASSSSSSVYPSSSTTSSYGRSSSTSGSSLPTIGEGSFSVPALLERSSSIEKSSKEEISKLKEECSILKTQLYEKDGEIKILRDNLRKKEEEVATHQKEKIIRIESSQREQTEREKSLKTEVDRLQVQLQFKERDIQEIQAVKDNLEHRTSLLLEGSPSRPGKMSPVSKSPRFRKDTATEDSYKNTMGMGFPSTQSFLSEHQRAEKRQSRAKMIDKGIMTEKKTVRSSCVQQRRMKLRSNLSEGRRAGAQMVADIVEVNTVLPALHKDRGLIDLLHGQTVKGEGSAIHFERDTSNFLSPVLKRRLKDVRFMQPDSPTAKPLVTVDNFSLSEHALSRLLSPEGSQETSSHNAIKFLPLINEYLHHYIEMIESISEDFNVAGSTTSESASIKTSSCDSSAHSLSDSINSLHRGDAVYLYNLERLTRISLQVLHKLLSCNASVCDVILRNPPLEDSLKENVQHSNQEQILQISSLSFITGDENFIQSSADLNIFNNICTLASTQHTKSGFNGCIVQAALKVLLALSSQATGTQLKRFSETQMHSVVSACLLCDTVPSVIVMGLSLLHQLVKFNFIVPSLCTRRGDCLLLALYSLGCSKMTSFVEDIKQEILHLVVGCISGVCRQRGGSTLLVESNCHCSVEAVKAVILILHKVLENYHLKTDDKLLNTMRKGLTLLHILFLKDNHFWDHHYEVESQYVHLISGLNTIFKQLPGNNDTELTALGDLLEQDDSECSQDSEESVQNDSITAMNE